MCAVQRNDSNGDKGILEMHHRQLTLLIEREGDWYVSLCPEFDIASQGKTVDQARGNLKKALELFFWNQLRQTRLASGIT